MIFLAEIADKMPTVAGTAVRGIVLAAFSALLARQRWWLFFIPLPLILFGITSNGANCKNRALDN